MKTIRNNYFLVCIAAIMCLVWALAACGSISIQVDSTGGATATTDYTSDGLATRPPESGGLGTVTPQSGGLATRAPQSGGLGTVTPQSGGLATRAPQSGGPGTVTPSSRRTAIPTQPASVNGYKTIAVSALPPEAQTTMQLIQQGGPFPYRQDGVVFQNREGILPKEKQGYYHEYTVVTPGSSDRGTRRIIVGSSGEFYYTDDHYNSFKVILINE